MCVCVLHPFARLELEASAAADGIKDYNSLCQHYGPSEVMMGPAAARRPVQQTRVHCKVLTNQREFSLGLLRRETSSQQKKQGTDLVPPGVS